MTCFVSIFIVSYQVTNVLVYIVLGLMFNEQMIVMHLPLPLNICWLVLFCSLSRCCNSFYYFQLIGNEQNQTITTPLMEDDHEEDVLAMPLVEDNVCVPALNIEKVIRNCYCLTNSMVNMFRQK